MQLKKSFTLIELLIVVVVIGILATLAVPQYKIFVDKAKIAEGKILLGHVADADIYYAMENGGDGHLGKFYSIADDWPSYFLATKPVSKYWEFQLGNGPEPRCIIKGREACDGRRYSVSATVGGAHINNVFALEIWVTPSGKKQKSYRVFYYGDNDVECVSSMYDEWPI